MIPGLRIFSVVIFSLVFMFSAFAQDSTASPYQWKVESNRLAEGKYELVFSAPEQPSWQFYAPNHVLFDVQTTELQFADSGIIHNNVFRFSDSVSTFSPVFETNIILLKGAPRFTIPISINGAVPGRLQGTLLYTYGNTEEFYPATRLAFTVEMEGGVKADDIRIASIDINNPVAPCGDEGTSGKSIIAIFFLGVLGGLIALLTPCVFPMIPVTVTFFTKKSGDRKKGISNAVIYGAFIFLIYVLITLPFHIAGKAISPEIFNNISTNVYLNLFFFAIFIFFALSFFGLFEISLPAGIANRMDSKSGIGKIGGIFFMAATLAIVSFSCTGPILGTLLAGVADQGAWPLTAGAAGFGVALGLPFALFAMFPNWLQSLPKSGGWMTDVKVVLGFLEVALAIKFLSNADLVKQWGLLKREVFIGSWVIVGLLIVIYLLGRLNIAHRTPVKKFSAGRIFFVSLFAAMTIYLAQGLLFPKPQSLRLISGFPPPRTYSLFPPDKSNFQPMHNDYAGALERSRAEKKPVLIDFTGWACVNCRKMEEKVWPDPLVDSLMRNEFIVVSLYVDERQNLPLANQTVATLSNGTEKPIITVGDKWATFQVENFGATAQPQYAIISEDQVALTRTKYYTDDADEFAEWLQCGLKAHKEMLEKKETAR